MKIPTTTAHAVQNPGLRPKRKPAKFVAQLLKAALLKTTQPVCAVTALLISMTCGNAHANDWHIGTMPTITQPYWFQITKGNDKFVATAGHNTTTTAAVSTDGIS